MSPFTTLLRRRLSPAVQNAGFFDLPQIGFVLLCLSAVGGSVNNESARLTAVWLIVWLVLSLAIGHAARSPFVWRLTCYAVVAGASLIALYFITQFSSLVVPDKIAVLESAGRALSDRSPRLLFWTPFPNSLATLLEGALLIAVGLALDGVSGSKKMVLAIAAATIAFACLLTMSRGAWSGVLTGAVVWAVTAAAPRRARSFIAASFLIAVPAVGFLMAWKPGLDAVAAATTAAGRVFARPDRLDIYTKSIGLLDDVGLVGLGPGEQFAVPFARYALVIQVPFVTYPHHLTLHVWLAYGLAGVAIWAWWLSAVATSVAIAERQRVSHAFRGVWTGFLAVLVHSLSDGRQAVDPWTWAPLFLCSALIAARQRRTARQISLSLLTLPFMAGVFVLAVGIARYWPIPAAWHTNRGLLCETLAAQPGASAPLATCAADQYRQAIGIDRLNAGARRRLALMAADAGEFDSAYAHATIALEADPDGYATRKIAGLVATWAGHLDVAYPLLLTIPGSAQELETWSAAWKARGRSGASERSTQLALRLIASRE